MATTTLASSLLAFVNSCSPEQIFALQQVLNQSRPNNVAQAAASETNSMTVAANTKTTTVVPVTTVSKKQRNKSSKSGPPKRPLNSWMAFRKYYSASLSPNTQKAISKILTIWWRADLFEAKWALIAKAYSILRATREKEEIPFDGFFAICAPLLNLIPPAQYQGVMGWQITPAGPHSEDKMPTLTRVFMPNVDQIKQFYKTYNLGVNDIIVACKKHGFIQDVQERVDTPQGLTMAVLPYAPFQADNSTTNQHADTMMPPFSPATEKLANDLAAAMTQAPVGETALAKATVAMSTVDCANPNDFAFDPMGTLDISFDPNMGDPWDAFDPEMIGNGVDNGGIDFSMWLQSGNYV